MAEQAKTPKTLNNRPTDPDLIKAVISNCRPVSLIRRKVKQNMIGKLGCFGLGGAWAAAGATGLVTLSGFTLAPALGLLAASTLFYKAPEETVDQVHQEINMPQDIIPRPSFLRDDVSQTSKNFMILPIVAAAAATVGTFVGLPTALAGLCCAAVGALGVANSFLSDGATLTRISNPRLTAIYQGRMQRNLKFRQQVEACSRIVEQSQQRAASAQAQRNRHGGRKEGTGTSYNPLDPTDFRNYGHNDSNDSSGGNTGSGSSSPSPD